MKGMDGIISNDMIDTAPAAISFIMLALAALTFVYNGLFDYLMGLANLKLSADSVVPFIVILIAILPLAFLRIWTANRLRAIMYLSWAIYLPSVLYFSGIDPFKILNFSLNFSIFSSRLPLLAIELAGVFLAGAGLTVRSFLQMKSARDNFRSRNADKAEARGALYKNAIFEMKLIILSTVAVLLFMAGAPFLQQYILAILKAGGFIFTVIGLGSVLVLALIFSIFLLPRKNGEKE